METDVSIIEVSLPFVVFCNGVSKALARTLPHQKGSATEDGSMIKVCNEPGIVLARLRESPQLVFEWSRIVVHHALGWPPRGLSAAPDELAQVTRILLLNAMEWFALAHEYGHHVMRHGQATSSSTTRNIFEDEHEADLFARSVSIALGGKTEVLNMYALSGVGGIIVLGMMDLVRRGRTVLKTGLDNAPPRRSHPPLADRVTAFGLLDQHLAEELRAAASDMRNCFTSILEGIWTEVLPIVQQLHKEGMRPEEMPGHEDGWLPP